MSDNLDPEATVPPPVPAPEEAPPPQPAAPLPLPNTGKPTLTGE